MRGAGPKPYIYRMTRGPRARFLGLGLSVSEAEDLETLAKAFGSRVERADGPGGGFVVRLRDPQGIEVDVLHGMTPAHLCRFVRRSSTMHPAISFASTIPSVRSSSRRRSRSSATSCWKRRISIPSVRWYIDNFGFIPSDVMCLPDGTPVGSFMRLDHGAEPTDHHTLFVSMGLELKADHVAFEVVDLDAIEMGQQVMMANRLPACMGRRPPSARKPDLRLLA